MNKYIVITSIQYPTEAIRKYSEFKDFQLIVVGDKKTPKGWCFDNVIYLSPETQEEIKYEICGNLPWNHYSRKMIGYLYAIKEGAELIIDSDDDNIPNNNWFLEKFDGNFNVIKNNERFVNIYQCFSNEYIWPRGFPLNQITKKHDLLITNKMISVGIWQGLVNGDPDVDAIYRLIINQKLNFENNVSVVLDEGNICPINSQNTIFRKDVFPLLYLPAFVNFRVTDILRGLIAQPILWSHNIRIGFTKPTVNQERNVHNLMKDFESEIPCYLYTEKIVESVLNCVKATDSLKDNLYNAYHGLFIQDIVTYQEIELLNLWLNDISIL